VPAGVPEQNDSNLVSAWKTREPVDPSVEKKNITSVTYKQVPGIGYRVVATTKHLQTSDDGNSVGWCCMKPACIREPYSHLSRPKEL
jgi:hypothetical protein